MSKLSTKPISASITDGYVHIILPDLGEPTGWKSYRIKLEDFASGAPAASAVSTVTTNFDGNLSATDDTVQKALDTLDDMVASGSDELVKYDAGDTTAGYLSAKIIAGTGISLSEGTGGDENKLKITNDVSIAGLLNETSHDLLDHAGLTGIPSIAGLLDETAHDLLDHTGLTGVGTGDMILASIQSVTGLKTFDKDKAAMKGTSTGKNILSVANTSATDYTNTLPAKNGTIAMIDDISNISYIDGSIGDTGGDYTTLSDAQTAGKVKLKMSSNLTLAADFTLTSAMTLDLNGYTLICGAYTFTRSSGSLKIYCSSRVGNISFGYASAKNLFNSFTSATLTLFDIGTITNSSSSNDTAVSTVGYFRNITNVVIPNKTYGGFTLAQGSYMENVKITGGGTGSYYVIYATSSIINNITLEGTYNTSFPTVGFVTSTVDGIFCNNANGVVVWNNNSKVNGIIRITAQPITLSNANVAQYSNSDFTAMLTGSNAYMYLTNCNAKAAFALTSNNSDKLVLVNCHFTSTFTVIGGYANTDRWFFSNCIFVGNATFIATAILAGSKVIGCEFQGTFVSNTDGLQIIGNNMLSTSTLNADYMKFNNNICTGAVTISSGAEYNILTGNTLTGGLTDSSASTNNIIKDNL